MELKFLYMLRMLSNVFCSNRTFMELKSRMSGDAEAGSHRSNRTFMELKCPHI